MVASAGQFAAAAPLAQSAGGPLVKRLPPILRAEVLMTLLGLVVLGLALVVFVVLWSRYVRRLARSRPPTRSPIVDEWYRQRPRPVDGDSDPTDADVDGDS